MAIYTNIHNFHHTILGITEETRKYIEDQIDYYTGEAESYREIVESYGPDVESVSDATFGMIAGCIYSAFLQVYQSQKKNPSLEEIQEFNQIIREHTADIKKSIFPKEHGSESSESD